MGVYGEIFHFLSDPAEISYLTTKINRSRISFKFQLKWTSEKKVTDKKHLTNLYEMNSSLVWLYYSHVHVAEQWKLYKNHK